MSDKNRQRRVIVVVRQAPNWRNVGPSYWEDLSRFEALIGRQPGSVARMIHAWDAAMTTSFFTIRAKMAVITRANLRRARGVEIIGIDRFRQMPVDPNAIYNFIDDDDWYSPNIGVELKRLRIEHDGVVWRSVRYDGELTARPLDEFCYTNNYAVQGAALLRDADLKHMAEQHFTVMTAINEQRLKLDSLDMILGITNKHPASTVVLERAWETWTHEGPRHVLEQAQARARLLPDARRAGVSWAEREMRRVRRVILSLRPR